MAEASDEAPAGFLARWGRRKALARAGQPLPELPPAPAVPAIPVAMPRAAPQTTAADSPEAPVVQAMDPPPELVAAPTWSDVAELKADSDYTRFMAQDVDLGVQRAAMKKLFFSDPHFNVMDGLDTYIDDYSQPDPIPLAMLRQMNQSRALNLFAQEETTPPGDAQDLTLDARTEPASPPPSSTPAIETSSQPDDDDPDLQLQQDPAAGRPGAAKSPGT
ncbi:DUF3306 domain-containing protein [Paucibacter sp. Y2R2-4]|uniref:DUF3306 domain-containing protein n=1 Tax=Paucibacter sp. Y2R2-4 TaxID=2893553 RepID=UPI0021E4FE4D|nr:DUF3306 domain-containing protein [Paucibacter sp. Y2R2-4]MCV2349008.1 DUF3306 domain-containing protein [Paucibacter sp. Y2R2-4]